MKIWRLMAQARQRQLSVDEYVAQLLAAGRVPRDTLVRLFHGEARRTPDEDRTRRGIALLRRAVALVPAPTRPGLLCTLGWLQWARGKRVVAAAYLAEAARIQPDNILACGLGIVVATKVPMWLTARQSGYDALPLRRGGTMEAWDCSHSGRSTTTSGRASRRSRSASRARRSDSRMPRRSMRAGSPRGLGAAVESIVIPVVPVIEIAESQESGEGEGDPDGLADQALDGQMSTLCPSASARVHHSGALLSSAMTPPAASAAATRSSAVARRHDDVDVHAPADRLLDRLQPDERATARGIDELDVADRVVAGRRLPERQDPARVRRRDGDHELILRSRRLARRRDRGRPRRSAGRARHPSSSAPSRSG